MTALPLDSIKIGARFRQDHGNIVALAHERDKGNPSLKLVRFRPFPQRGSAQKPASQPSLASTRQEPELADSEP